MKLESDGILIDIRPFNERDSLARVFSRDFGVICGMMRGAVVAKKNIPLVGQVGHMVWNARLDSQLGVFHWDAMRNMAAGVMYDARRLGMLNAAFGLMATLLPEREGYATLYDETIDFIMNLVATQTPERAYLDWELNFLRDIGYALNLSVCAGCGRQDNLIYLSPRTFRAVCADCGAPYADKLYHLPPSIALGAKLLAQICAAQGAMLPVARQILHDK